MGYFQVRYDSRGVNYDRRGFIRLATDWTISEIFLATKFLTNVAQIFGNFGVIFK